MRSLPTEARQVLNLLRMEDAVAGSLVLIHRLIERWGDGPDHVLAEGIIWLVEHGYVDDRPTGYLLTDKGAAYLSDDQDPVLEVNFRGGL